MPPLHRAVFLDRDGVLNAPLVRDGKPYPPAHLGEFVLLEGVREACADLRAAGFLLVVATNQPDVGRGTQTRAAVEEMHAHLARELPLDRIEVCYDPGGGLPSPDRKPAPGMLLRAGGGALDRPRRFLHGRRPVARYRLRRGGGLHHGFHRPRLLRRKLRARSRTSAAQICARRRIDSVIHRLAVDKKYSDRSLCVLRSSTWERCKSEWLARASVIRSKSESAWHA